MTSTEIARALRRHRPVAPLELRQRIVALEAPAPDGHRRLGTRRRLFVALPIAAGLAVALAAGVVLTRSQDGQERVAHGSAATVESAAPATGSVADAAKLQAGAAPSSALPRARAVAATLVVSVEDGSDVGPTAQRAIAIAADLGGFVAGSQVVSGDQGFASVTLKVPSTRAEEAVTRLTQLGTVVSQDVRTQDLQESLDTLARAIRATRSQLAVVLARLATDKLAAEERARLDARREALREQLRVMRAQQGETLEQASLATIQLDVRTQDSTTGAAVPSPLDRTLDRALAVLAWEGVALLGLVLLVGPPLVVALAGWGLVRGYRRRADERLLEA